MLERPAPEPEPAWAQATAPAPSEEPSGWGAAEDNRPSWLTQSVDESSNSTIRGIAPDHQFASDTEPPAPEAAAAPEAEGEGGQGSGSPYEVDVDVLRILSEETFRPPKR